MVAISMPIGAVVTAAHSTPQFAIGERAFGIGGDVYIYGQYNTAGTGLAKGHAVAIPATGSTMLELTVALCSADLGIGWSQVGGTDSANAVTAGAYFWAQIEGIGTIATLSACVGAVPLYPTTTAGVLDDSSAGTLIRGVTLVATVTGNGTRLGTGHLRGARVGATIA